MPKREITPAYIAAHIRRFASRRRYCACTLKECNGFSRRRSNRRDGIPRNCERWPFASGAAILRERSLEFLLQVADELFSGRILEEKIFAVFLMEKLTDEFGDDEFRLFESWLLRISSWADHDALVHYLIAPMVVAKPDRAGRVFRWAKSPDRWHRRAACVALIQGTRRKMFPSEIKRLSNLLLSDEDDMVQKGLGWLLRETAKADAKRTVPYLMSIREHAPRLVLRTACETLPAGVRKKILAKPA